MSSLPDISALHDSIQHCLIKDRHSLRRDVRTIEQRIKQQKPVDQLLEKMIARVQKSQNEVAVRHQPVAIHYPPGLPVSGKRDDILQAIQSHQVVVVAGETGSGKTTQLPKICIEAGLGVYGRIAHTQPRRLAARAVATRIAEEMQCELGQQVGYQVRFTDQSNEQTRIKLMTDGILLAQTQRDKYLNEYDAIIIDEAHERSLNIDFLLGYLKQLLSKRPDLKIIITSATIDVDRFSQHFNQAPVIEVSGRTFPVEMRYRSLLRDVADVDSENTNNEDRSLFEGVADALAELRQEDKQQGSPGDVLVFLPGERDIRECAEFLRKAHLPATQILPLYARLSQAEQQKIFHPQGGRRVVLATNVAETSLTVPGIRYVVDSGIARISRYSYRSKVQRLPIEAISQASANQRAGRCGRTEPGVCIRLFDEEDFQGRPEFTDPEIRRTNLAAVVLQMLHLKLGRLQDFPFIDPPDERFVKDGFTLLQELEAVDANQNLTPLGRQMARFPVDPRIARMMLEGHRQGALTEVLVMAAALTVQDPKERPPERQQAADEKHKLWQDEDSDFVSAWNLWQVYEEQRQELSQNQLRKWCGKHFLSFMRLREWRDTHRQLHLLCKELNLTEKKQAASYEAIHKALLSGMLSQIGFKSEGQEYLGARHRKFFIFPASSQHKKKPKWVMAAELVETSRLFARTVAKIEPQWIEEVGKPLLKYQYFEPHWNSQRGQSLAFEQSTLYGLIINPKKRINYAHKHPVEARQILIQDGLVAQSIKLKSAFYVHNIKLLKEVTEYEEKSRRRDLVLDDAYLFDFYNKALPESVVSAQHLDRWYQQASEAEQKALYFTRDFLLNPAASGIGVDDYPAELEWQGMAFPLSYSFAPGSMEDGVSLSVPVAMLQQVPDARVEWLVPGFIEEKVAAIIKGLPKTIRKRFVPVPDTVSSFLARASAQKGSLYSQLLVFLNQDLRPDVLELQQLLDIDIADHLRMNIRVMSDAHKLLAQSRDLTTLKNDYSDLSQSHVQTLIHQDFQRSQILSWDFGDLPRSTQSNVNGLPVRAFPCLKSNGKQGEKASIELTVEADEQLASQQHRQGVCQLLRRQLPEQERLIKGHIQQQMKSKWLYAKGLGSQHDLQSSLIEACFLHVFLPEGQALPYSQSEFQQCLDKRGELFPFAEQLLKLFVEWIEQRHNILKAMSGAVSLDRAMAYSDIKVHLERLMATNFMQQTPWKYLQRYQRYLKAMAYRIEKLQGNLPRDRQSMMEFDSLYKPYRERSEQQPPAYGSDLYEFGWLLEEWRVSLFAQPLGTQEAVSLKRLQKRWLEISQ